MSSPGLGVDTDIDKLEILLEEEFNLNPADPPILALFTEFPSNPLLRSANLPRLRALADKYDFLIIIDETIGNFVNVEAWPDVACPKFSAEHLMLWEEGMHFLFYV